MKKVYAFIFLIFTISVIALLYFTDRYGIDLYSFYAKKMQIPLFTGFLTLSGFLLSLKTVILIKLKEGLYDHKQYQKLVQEKQALNSGYTYYGPLSRLSHFLVHSVLLALLTSFFQFSAGFWNLDIVAAIGISLAITTIIVVLLAWWNIRQNLNCWFELLEKEKREVNGG